MESCVESVFPGAVVDTVGHEESATKEKPETNGVLPASAGEGAAREVAGEKSPWSGWAWLGFCKKKSAHIRHIAHVKMDAFSVPAEKQLSSRLRAKLAERVRRILESYTPAVEAAAADDFYLDFGSTERGHADFSEILRRLQSEVFKNTGLRVSIGAGSTNAVAAVASRVAGADGFRLVGSGEEKSFLAPLAVEKLYGIVAWRAKLLATRGVRTIGQLREVPKRALQATFGDAMGQHIWEQARGLDGSRLRARSTAKCISRETVIEGGSRDPLILRNAIEYLSERITEVLREDRMTAGIVGLRIEYADHFMNAETVRIVSPTNNASDLRNAMNSLTEKMCTRLSPVVRLALKVSNFEPARQKPVEFAAKLNLARRLDMGSTESYSWR